MDNLDKKKMVDFINGSCLIKGKKVSKSKLNQLSEESLLKIIKCRLEIEAAYNDYLNERENSAKQKSSKADQEYALSYSSHDGKTEKEIIKALEAMVNSVLDNPTSFTSIAKFKSFVDSIPYGKIPSETLMHLIDKVLEIDSNIAFVLLTYATEQDVFLQKRDKST